MESDGCESFFESDLEKLHLTIGLPLCLDSDNFAESGSSGQRLESSYVS